MGKLIKVEDALICCRGNNAQFVKDTRANFSALASEFLSEFGKAKEAGAPLAMVGARVVWLVKSIQAVAAPKELTSSPLGLGIGASTQLMEWKPPELQLEPDPYVNEMGGINIDQALTLYEVAAQQAQVRLGQRVRDCHNERALRQDNPARYVSGSIRSRKARPKLGQRFLNFVSKFVKKP